MAERTDPAQRHVTEARQGACLRLETARRRRRDRARRRARLRARRGRRLRHGGNAPAWLAGADPVALNYVENPSTFIFPITNRIGNHLVENGLQPLLNFFTQTPAPLMLARPDADRIPPLGPAAGGDDVRDALRDRRGRRVETRR